MKGIETRNSGSGFRVSGFGFRGSDSGFRVYAVGICWVQGPGRNRESGEDRRPSDQDPNS